MIGRFASLVAGIAWAAAAAAAGPAETIAEASARVGRAQAELAAARGAPDRIAALSVAIADCEAALAALRGGVTGAAAREREIALGLADRREEIMRLLAALQTTRRAPPAPALHPQGPLAAARAAAMLAQLNPALEARADALADELAALAEARRLRAEGGGELAAGLAALNAARAELRQAIAETPAPPVELDPALVSMARKSDTLTALAAALAGPGAEEPQGATAPRALLPPVQGTVLRGFDEPDAAGVRRPGLVMAAPPLALVSAPADGTVRYAGPFLDYGYVVVLEADHGTLVVLAGLAQLQVRTGAAVRRGELLGLLGGRALDVEEYVMLPDAGTGAGASETLYIEIRHGNGPVDPAPWFAGGNG